MEVKPDLSRKDFNKRLGRRLKQAREDADLTQREMADALGIELDAYKKYENRSPVPAYFIPRICTELDITAWWLLTGHWTQSVETTPGPQARAAKG